MEPVEAPEEAKLLELTAPTTFKRLRESQIDPVEYVRVIAQALYSLGYNKAGSVLEEESKIPLQDGTVTELRKSVLTGDCDRAVELLSNFNFRRGEVGGAECRFRIFEQLYLEYLEEGRIDEALKVLRRQLSTSAGHVERTHFLSGLLSIEDPVLLRREASWEGAGTASRLNLLRSIGEEVDSSQMIPDFRLETLLDDALKVQKSRRAYKNAFSRNLSLLESYKDAKDSIPNRTAQTLKGHTDEVWYVAFSHDGKYLASSSKDKSVIVWEKEKSGVFSMLRKLQGHEGPVGFLSWNLESTRLISCAHDRSGRLWDINSGRCVRTHQFLDIAIASGWLPDGRYVVGCVNKVVTLYDASGDAAHVWSTPPVNDLVVLPDGSSVVVATNENVLILNVNSKEEVSLRENSEVMSLFAGQDNRHALFNLKNQEIHMWDLKERRQVFKYDGLKQGRYVIRTCLGGLEEHFLASGSEDSQVYIWRRNKPRPIAILPGHSGTINAVSWSIADPHLIASASDDRTIRIWTAEDKDEENRDATKEM